MTESQIERRLVQGVKAMGGKAYKFTSPGNVGVPDRLVVMPGGGVFFVELKSERGRLSPNQAHQISQLEKLGHTVSVLYGKEDVDKFLRAVSWFLEPADGEDDAI